MSEPDWSDSDSFGNHLSDFHDFSNSDNDKVIIDMDSKPVKPLSTKVPISVPITKKVIPVKKHNEQTKLIKPNDTNNPNNTHKIDDKADVVIKNNSKKTDNKISKKKNGDIKDKIDEEKEELKKENVNKADSKFEFNEETIDFFSRDILNNFSKICIVNSTFNNDTELLCLLFKVKIFTEYKCSVKKCKIGKTWLDKPIQLLINRKNGKWTDLTKDNLELICPNCFIAKYGIEIFIKIKGQTIFTCKLCNFPLQGFSNSKKKERYCMACEHRIMNSGYFDKRSDFINELKETIDETSTLKKDEFTNSNYYNEVSKYKDFSKGKKNKDNKTVSSAPIINLNMSVPDLNELINDDS
jgi:hypothetical protein